MKIAINNAYGGFCLPHNISKHFKTKYYEIPRHNLKLIKLLKEYPVSDIIIITIPNGLDYEIDNYDGLETIKTIFNVTKQDLIKGLNNKQLKLTSIADYIKLI